MTDKPAQHPRTPAVSLRCPNCGAPLVSLSPHCPMCYFNLTSSGIELPARPIEPSQGGAAKFLLGCLFSGLGAFLAAIVWLFAAAATSKMLGFIAIALGILAGLGMNLGYRVRSNRAGITATLIALLGLVVTQVAIFSFFFYIVLTGDTHVSENKRRYLQFVRAREAMCEKSLPVDAGHQEAWEKALREAERETAALTEAEIEERWYETVTQNELNDEWGDPTNEKRARLAHHRADRTIKLEGLAYSNPRRQKLIHAEFTAIKSWPDSKVETAVKQLEQWEKDGKWNDVDYVRAELARHFLDRAIEEKQDAQSPDEEYWYPKDDEWETMYKVAVEEASKLSEADRLAQLKSIEERSEREELCYDLVEHRTSVRAKLLGLSYADPKRDAMYDEEMEKCRAMSPEQIESADSEIEQWHETGRFASPESIRCELIHAFMNESNKDSFASDDDDKPVPITKQTPADREKEWQTKYAAAKSKVDEIPPERHAETLKELEENMDKFYTEQNKKWQSKFDNKKQDDQRALFNLIRALVNTMVTPAIFLFNALGLVAAFSLARGKRK